MSPITDWLSAAVADRYRIERFVQETTTTASLNHPHILPLFDFLNDLKRRMASP